MIHPRLPAAVAALTAVLFLFLAAHAVARAERNVDWPQLGFDSGHAGFNPHERLISPVNVNQLQQQWSYNLGDWVGDMVENGGILFAPSASGELFALNARTGKQLWTFTSGIQYGWNTGTNTVAADAGLLFTECDMTGNVQGLCALQAETGAVQWSYGLGSASYAGAPPAVANGLVYFEECTASGCAYVALNETNGAVVWTLPEGCSGNLGIPPAIYKGVLYVGEGCNEQQGTDIVALSAATGSPVWSRTVIGETTGLTVGHDIVAYARFDGSNAYLGALRAKNGRTLWGPTYINSKEITSMPAIAYGMVFAWIFINDYGHVDAYDERFGTQYWDYAIARSFPSIANGVAYIAFNGTTLALNAHTGGYLWNQSGTDNLVLPIILNGVVYGGCNGGYVCAYALPGNAYLHQNIKRLR
jgi:outer membrane protein assembly factor BamB